MFRKWKALSVFCLGALVLPGVQSVHSAPAGSESDFQNEIRLSCEKYAKEDQIPPKEVKEYIALCIRDFSEAQPTDEFPPFESEEGILGGPSAGDYHPLDKSREMERARPIDPPVANTPAPAKPATPAAKPAAPTASPPPAPAATGAMPVAKPPVPATGAMPAARPPVPATGAPVVPTAKPPALPADGKPSPAP
ncbi:MAG: hypothetical protein H7838_10095 [Magnetococcus sp. DMHC-8]